MMGSHTKEGIARALSADIPASAAGKVMLMQTFICIKEATSGEPAGACANKVLAIGW